VKNCGSDIRGHVAKIELIKAAPARESRGWMQWPQSEDFSLQFMRVLGAAHDGGSTVSECFLAARGIDPRDEESWFREWKRIADINSKRAEIALRSGHAQTALSNWLRATNYYRTALVFLGSHDPRYAAGINDMQTCSQLYLRHAVGAGETVEIPWSDGVLQGYFLPAAQQAGLAPVVVCIGGPDHFKEEYLHSLPRFAHRRGMSLLLVDLPGQDHRSPRDRILGRYDIETSISGWVDYLLTRDDIDPDRIAICGDGLGASFATRAASMDDRFAAAVCDAGIWDLNERAFALNRLSGNVGCDAPGGIAGFFSSSIARTVRCPILVTVGEYGWLEPAHVRDCCEELRRNGVDIDLKIFSESETSAVPAQLDSSTIGNEFIFDWMSDRLAADSKQRKIR
jgi:dienelactone hydrolase